MWEPVRERWQSFSIEQKLSVVVLGMCGVFAIGLSFYRLQESVRSPFLVADSTIQDTKKLVGSSPAEDDARLKRIDTDGDGLSDYNEINVFHTNPNLKDTCGDGIPDNIRVYTGKNIACNGQQGNPSGFIDVSQAENVTSTQPVPGSYTPTAQGIDLTSMFQSLNAQAITSAASSTSSTGTPVIPQLSSVLPRDAAQIRASLKGRVDDATLQKATDADLLQAYDLSVVQMNQASAPADASQSATDNSGDTLQ